MKRISEMSGDEYREFIRQILDDTLESLHYRIMMETELTTDQVKEDIELVLRSMGYGR